MESFNLKFVGVVEKYPELYNHTLKSYSRRDATEKAWSNVADEVNLSVNECKEKWRNLRTVFVKHLNSKLNPKKGRRYYLMDAMQFTVPFVRVVKPVETLSAETSKPADDEMVDVKPIVADTEMKDITSPSAQSSDSCQDSRASPTSLSRGPNGLPVRKRTSRKRSLHVDTGEEDVSDHFIAKRHNSTGHFRPKEEKDKREEGIERFLLSLVPDLMTLDDVQLRKYKQNALLLIDEVINESLSLPHHSAYTYQHGS